jgi:molecular chaperone GrpE
MTKVKHHKGDDNDDLKKKIAEAKKKAEIKESQLSEESPLSETDQLREDLEKMTEYAKRTMADMQNLQRRVEEERAGIFQMATADFISKILPVLDNLDRAAAHMPEEAGEWFKGIEMSFQQLHKIIEEAGLTKMETVEQKFDPNLHEALMQAPGEKDIILEELESGYLLGDRVIRHAKVKVGNGEQTK